MKLLVLGSEGFIGGNAVRYFQSLGYEVYKADIILKVEDNYTVINPEMPDYAAIFAKNEVDVCLNATGAANVQFSFSNPATDYALNVANVYYILDSIRQYNPRCRLINLSSAAVYGNPVSLPIGIGSALKPLSPYGWHKMYSEQICAEFFHCFGIQTISLRVFSAYGEGLKKQIFWDVWQKIRNTKTKRIEIFGTGNESRDFIYILDLLHAIDCIIGKSDFHAQPINVATGREVTIAAAVTTFVNFIDPEVEVIFNAREKIGDPLNWAADVAPLNELGFSPKYSLAGGLEKTASWILNNNG